MFYSLDESTDQTDIAQQAIFVRVDRYFDIFKKLWSVASLKDRITGEDNSKALKKVMKFNNLRFENLAVVATDGFLCMIGQHTGLIAFLKKQDGIDRSYHCIIHQENL